MRRARAAAAPLTRSALPALGAYRYMALRGASCMCGDAFGAHGPLNEAYCQQTCAGTPRIDCLPSAADLALARSVTRAQEPLLFDKQPYVARCGGGVALPPLEHRALCPTAAPKPAPSPRPSPSPSSRLDDGVDFSRFGLGVYSGPRNSVYRVSSGRQRVCGDVGRVARVAAPNVDTCRLARRCTLDRLLCNGTVVDNIAQFDRPLAICVVQRLECDDEAVDLVNEYDATDW